VVRIADSMPIMMASGKRASQAKVASRLADKGYCASKGVHIYGVKLHVVAERRRGHMPLPRRAGLTPGSEHDLTALRRVLPDIRGGWLYGDKAYCDDPMKERLADEQNLELRTPVKRKKGQKHLSAADKLFSTAVSKVRQPIESLFNWIDEKTGIQRASKVRSYRAYSCTPSDGSPPRCFCSPSTLDPHWRNGRRSVYHKLPCIYSVHCTFVR